MVDWRVLALVAAALITSFIIHMPVEAQGQVFHIVVNPSPVYNDLFDSYYKGILANPCSNFNQWINQGVRESLCLGERVYPTPYLDYKFPEAPLSGIAWLGLTGLAFAFVGDVLSPAYATVLYFIQFSISTLSILLALMVFLRWSRSHGLNRWFPLGLVSIIVYGVYGFDSMALPFYVSFISSFLDRNYSRALLFSSILAAWNPFFTVLVGLTLAYMAYETSSLREYAGLMPGLIAYVALYLASPPSFEHLVSKYVNPVFNSSIYWLFTGVANSQALYATAWGIASTLILILYGLRSSEGDATVHATSIVIAAWILNPVAVPQTILFTIPLLYLLDADRRVRVSALVSEVLNALVIITWFHDLAIRESLNKYLGLGLPVENNPASMSSPVFWIIQFRNILVIALLARLIADHWERLKNRGNINK